MNTAVITSDQSLLDVAIQHSGSFEAVFDIAMQNGISLTDDTTPGQTIQLADEPDNADVTDYYAVNDLHPASAITQDQIFDILGQGEGIEFWGIEFDFVVSGEIITPPRPLT